MKLIGELIELISRRAGLDNVGEVGQSVGVQTDSDLNGPQTPLTVKLNPDTSPGPSAGMSPQDTKLGEGVHVRG